MSPALSVVVATHNGSATIRRTLERLAWANVKGLDWEIIIVDNASTDRTLAALRSFEGRIPLRVLQCPVRGKNRALNYGLEHVCGEVVVLTDDDILPEANWLQAIEERSDRHPGVDLFGGPIAPAWEVPPPPWLGEVVPFGPVFGVTPADIPEGPVDPGRIWGGNMVVRRRVFDKGLRFDEDRGPGVGHYVMGGDTEFATRAAAAGYSAWWCPEIRVGHIIRPEQLQRGWLLRRAYRHGKSVWTEQGFSKGGIWPKLLGFPRYMLRKAAHEAVRALVCEVVRDRRGALGHWWRFFHLCGSMAQARAVRRRPG